MADHNRIRMVVLYMIICIAPFFNFYILSAVADQSNDNASLVLSNSTMAESAFIPPPSTLILLHQKQI